MKYFLVLEMEITAPHHLLVALLSAKLYELYRSDKFTNMSIVGLILVSNVINSVFQEKYIYFADQTKFDS